MARLRRCVPRFYLRCDLGDIVADVCELRARADTGPPTETLECALALDAVLAEWIDKLPLELRPFQLPRSDVGAYAPFDFVDIYPDIPAANLFNSSRLIRLLIQNVIQRHLLRCANSGASLASLDNKLTLSIAVQMEMITDICASVPFLFNPAPYTALASATLEPSVCSIPSSPMAQDPLAPPATPAAAGNALIWPLFVAAETDVCPDATVHWILDKLNYIGCVVGVRSALPLISVLLEKQEQEVLDLAKEFRLGRTTQGERRDAGVDVD